MRNTRGIFLQEAGRQQAEGEGFIPGMLGSGEGEAACVHMAGLSHTILQ